MWKRKLFTILALTSLGFSTNSFCQSVIPHPVPEEFASNQYVVTVNGQNVPVFHAGLNVYFASFDFTGKVDVSVTAQKEKGAKSVSEKYVGQVYYEYKAVDPGDFWKGNAQVRPLSRNIQTKTNGPVASFSLSEAGQYSVERPGTSNYLDQVLFLFANNPETNRPKAGDANVIYLESGIHHRNIDLESNQTLYLEAGAVLFGSINVWDAKNVTILGLGTVVYYGPQSEDRAPSYPVYATQKKNMFPISARDAKGINVSGITLICRSRTHLFPMYACFDVNCDNVKMISVNPQNVNGDGFDWFGGGQSKVTNCFVRCSDDCFAFMTAPFKNPEMQEVPEETEVKNIYIENCVLWSSLANVYRVGFSGFRLLTDNIVMKNSDLIHLGRGEWYAPWSVIHSIVPEKQVLESWEVKSSGRGKAIHTNYLFENVRFEEAIAFLGIQDETAEFRNIVFRNITMTGNPVPSLVMCEFDGLSFENVIQNGKPVLQKDDVPFTLNSKEIRNFKSK